MGTENADGRTILRAAGASMAMLELAATTGCGGGDGTADETER